MTGGILEQKREDDQRQQKAGCFPNDVSIDRSQHRYLVIIDRLRLLAPGPEATSLGRHTLKSSTTFHSLFFSPNIVSLIMVVMLTRTDDLGLGVSCCWLRAADFWLLALALALWLAVWLWGLILCFLLRLELTQSCCAEAARDAAKADASRQPRATTARAVL
jgi:hypothetical protein